MIAKRVVEQLVRGAAALLIVLGVSVAVYSAESRGD